MSARPARKLKYGSDALENLAKGVGTVARVVAPTLGPLGGVVMLDSYFGTPEIHVSEIDRRGSSPAIAADGYAISQEILVGDRFVNLGILLARDVSKEVKRRAGDGSTTAIVLTDALVSHGIQALAAGAEVRALRASIARAIKSAVDLLPRYAEPVSGLEECRRIGASAASGDEEVGNAVAQAVIEHGADFVAFEDGLDERVSVRLSAEYRVDRGYASPYLVNEPLHDRALLQNALVLLVSGALREGRALVAALEIAMAAERPLLVVADEFDADVMALLTVNLKNKRCVAVAVEAPAYGELRRALLEDLAALTGAELVAPSSVPQVDAAALGGAERVEVHRKHTEIMGGHGADRDLRCAQIGAEAGDADNAHERDELLARRARLSGGGVARVAIGGSTDSERRERTRRAEDALRSIEAALEEGVVPGGGATLFRIADSLDPADSGARVVAAALRAPARRIAANAGHDRAIVLDQLSKAGEGQTFDVERGRLVDAFESGIVEPVRMTRTALETAGSVARRILGTEVLVAQPLYGGRDPNTQREGGPANLAMNRR
ncbi:MAG: chaperonin GroEL [Thermoleophilaceae bacterium]|jgi:chaperonin GroEL|nr:chaperonin GroEL [Thermoleophilaceae bacterium]